MLELQLCPLVGGSTNSEYHCRDCIYATVGPSVPNPVELV